jgi:pyrroline-5-carboxylate reductase
MPNTPLFLGKGLTGYAMNSCCHGDDRIFVEKLFGSVGSVYPLAEELLNPLTALSGSGPAYFYQLIDYFAEAAVQHGFNKEEAIKIVSETAIGAAEMLLHTNLDPSELITQVKSKGGTTEAGLNVLQNSPTKEAIEDTITAATQRAAALGNRD